MMHVNRDNGFCTDEGRPILQDTRNTGPTTSHLIFLSRDRALRLIRIAIDLALAVLIRRSRRACALLITIPAGPWALRAACTTVGAARARTAVAAATVLAVVCAAVAIFAVTALGTLAVALFAPARGTGTLAVTVAVTPATRTRRRRAPVVAPNSRGRVLGPLHEGNVSARDDGSQLLTANLDTQTRPLKVPPMPK